jgi:FtsP/CotA-like multicopper oxidase with cupredoxin domain
MSRSARVASLAGTATIVALACIALATLMSQHASTSSGEVRTIHLVVRDMTYHLSGHTEPNPTLRVRRGDRVRIIVTNQDAGMKHDFGVDAWQTRTPLIDGIGEARVEFIAPVTPGEAVYSCTPHGAMMHGTIRIE